MPRDTRTLAERLRDHRAALVFAQQHGLTPAQAEIELARRAAEARHAAGARALAAKMHGPLPKPLTEPDETTPPWWQRD